MTQALTAAWLRWRRRLGVEGLVGLAALMAGAALACALPRLQQATRQMAATQAERSAQARQRAPARPAALSQVDSVRAYVAGFPLIEQNAADLQSVFAAANARHLQLAKGEYQLKADPAAPFVVYTATFPVHGDYDALKGFSADVLDALPHVAMDELHLTRDNAGSQVLDAVMRFSFYYRSTQ